MKLRQYRNAFIKTSGSQLSRIPRAAYTILSPESLELKRLKADLCTTYTILFNNVNLNASEPSLLKLTEILVDIRSRLSKVVEEFAQGVTSMPAAINAWNRLDVNINDFKSLYTFKSIPKRCCLKDFLIFHS